jgi:hypothetical protein
MGMVVRDPWFDYGTNPAFAGANRSAQDRMGAILAQAGVRWVRLDFRIAAGLDASQDFVDTEIAKNDYFIKEVAPRHGFKVLGLLAFDLLQGVDANLLDEVEAVDDPLYGGGVTPYMRVWLDRALRVADRYEGYVAAYQVLNEQNRLPQYLPGGPAGNAIEPSVVGRLVTKLYRFCRGIDLPVGQQARGCSGAQIILGGLHPRGTTDPVPQSDAEYLKDIYADAGSFTGFYNRHNFWPIDGVGYHPYPEEIRQSLSKQVLVDQGLARVRQALVEAGDPCRQLWVSEVGYNVGFDVDGPLNPIPRQTEQGQAEFMQDVYTTLASRQICGGVREIPHIFWFKYEDFPPATGANAQRWGIVQIPFRAPAPGESCPGGACYEVNGAPAMHRLAYFTYRELAGVQQPGIRLPLIFR